MPLILETNGLTKLYGGRAAVNQVSLHVKEGDIYGFIGKNGAGKTTFMRLVTGLARPDKGDMTLFGGQDFSRSRRRIGSMIEYPSLYPNMTARQNLEAHRLLLGIPEKGSVDEALKTVRLAETGNKKVKHFSLGMRQRLGIAQCLLGHPDFLILDEPINGLDPTGIKEIRDLLLMLNGEKRHHHPAFQPHLRGACENRHLLRHHQPRGTGGRIFQRRAANPMPALPAYPGGRRKKGGAGARKRTENRSVRRAA